MIAYGSERYMIETDLSQRYGIGYALSERQATQEQYLLIVYLGYLIIGGSIFMLGLAILEILLWKLGRLKEMYIFP
jgi:hypothetical protein